MSTPCFLFLLCSSLAEVCDLTSEVAYRIPGAPNAEWVDIYNRLYRERIIFIGKEIDDKLANEVIGVLLYLDSEELGSAAIAIGYRLAASMASFLLAAGEKGKRLLAPKRDMRDMAGRGGMCLSTASALGTTSVEAQQILQIHENIVRPGTWFRERSCTA
eukprot:Skav233546  [mRNA]  locus=scaffold563:86407:90712:+ [translate_table: standard]